MNAGIATLSMYDWPETAQALDAFWTLICQELTKSGVPAPGKFHHVEKQMPLWTSPELVVGQTCGWPYVNRLRDTAVPFARFDYGLDGCPAGLYQAYYIGRNETDAEFIEKAAGHARVKSVAINSDDSQSGFHVFAEISGMPAAETIPSDKRVVSGSHRESIRLVANDRAQIAAIDAVAFELSRRHDPETVAGVCVLGKSQPKPGLPLITSPQYASKTNDLYEAVKRAVEKLDTATRETLMIRDVLPASDEDYAVYVTG